MHTDSDTIIRRYREGDEDAFRDLFDGYAGQVQAHIQQRLTRVLQRKVSVADVLQETRIAAFDRRQDFEGNTRSAFGRWLMGIAERNARQTVRRYAGAAKRSVGREVSREQRLDTAQAVGQGPSPSQVAMESELVDLAEKALDALPEDYRQVLTLSREEGLSLRDAAERMGRSHDATKKLHRRAMFQFTEAFRRLRGRGDD